jgi:hypothetical protein
VKPINGLLAHPLLAELLAALRKETPYPTDNDFVFTSFKQGSVKSPPEKRMSNVKEVMAK